MPYPLLMTPSERDEYPRKRTFTAFCGQNWSSNDSWLPRFASFRETLGTFITRKRFIGFSPNFSRPWNSLE